RGSEPRAPRRQSAPVVRHQVPVRGALGAGGVRDREMAHIDAGAAGRTQRADRGSRPRVLRRTVRGGGRPPGLLLRARGARPAMSELPPTATAVVFPPLR